MHRSSAVSECDALPPKMVALVSVALLPPPPPLARAWMVSERSSPSTDAARWVRHAHSNVCIIGMAGPSGPSQPRTRLCTPESLLGILL